MHFLPYMLQSSDGGVAKTAYRNWVLKVTLMVMEMAVIIVAVLDLNPLGLVPICHPLGMLQCCNQLLGKLEN